MDMSGSPPPGEGEVEEEEEEDEEGDEKRLRYHYFHCGCGLPVHPADLILHCLSCLHLQPFVGPVHRITDPQVFLSSGLVVPRSLSLRTRKNHCLLTNQVSIYYRKMSELLGGYREDEGGEGGQDGECVDSLSTPPPAVMSFQVDETKPLLPDIDSKQQGSEDDETSQQNGILSPTDDNSKSGSVEEGPKDMATVLDVLFGGETPTVASMPSTGDASPTNASPSNASPSNASPSNASPSHASPSNASPCHATPSPQSSYNADKEECEKDKEESGSELNSLIDEMLDTKDSAKSSLVGGQQGSEPTSAPSTPQPTPTPTPPTISVRPMLDLMGNGRVKEEKIEEPFAALNDLVKNLQSPASSHQSSPSHHPPMHMKGPESFQMMSSMSSVPPPTMLGVQGQQVSIQKRPAPQSFPAGITLTKQARRDSESSSSSSQGPSSPRLPEGITLVKGPSSQKSDPVASMLATRGVSVMPSAGGRLNHQDTNQAVSITKTKPPVPQILAGSNSALTITATPPKRNRPSPAPLTTVDLTDDSIPSVRRSSVGGAPQVTTMMRPRVPIPMGSRGRPPAATCDVCDKVFANAEALRVHMQTHTAGRRGAIGPPRPPLRQPVPGAPPGSFPGSKPGVFECEVCTARYQTQQQLIQHTQRFHPDRFGGAVGHQFGFPVVNLDDSKTSAMLASLGIKYCIPMVDLQQSNGAPGHYALPIIAMDGSINPAVCNLDHMNCSNLLPLGPMKAIRRQ